MFAVSRVYSPVITLLTSSSHHSGYVCTPLPSATADALALPPMVPPDASTDPNQTAYTVTVDAVDDTVSTGISAHDRALTCRRLAEPGATAAAFRRPGHILPLRARDGGVRERQGHTEAAVEFCRLAGCEREVGVICELVEDGEQEASATEIRGSGMMRRDGCLRFAEKWGLKVCTIEDLVKYVEREQQ